MFLQPYQNIIVYSIHVATYLKVLNEFNDGIMLNELTLVTNVREWLAQACTHGDNSVPWTRREKILNTLFGSTVEVAETSFIVLFQLYPTESTQNCYLKTHMCVTTPKRTVLPFWSISQERVSFFCQHFASRKVHKILSKGQAFKNNIDFMSIHTPRNFKSKSYSFVRLQATFHLKITG